MLGWYGAGFLAHQAEPDPQLWAPRGLDAVLVGKIRPGADFYSRRTIRGVSQCFSRLGLSDRSGRPEHIGAPERFRFAPRIGLAYSPSTKWRTLGKILGGSGDTSIRAGYAVLNTMIEGNSIGIDEPQPPYGLSGTVFNGLFQSPYNLADGTPNASPYPLTFPPLNARASNPNPIAFVGVYNPQSGMTAPVPWDTYPYAEDYFLSFERQFPGQTVLSISYVGSQAHHLPLVYSANPGNPALCLALNQSGALAAGQSCGPGGENSTYNLVRPFTFGGTSLTPAGTALQGTRAGLNPTLSTMTCRGITLETTTIEGTVGNSHYNALQVTVKSRTKRLTYSLGYTYSRSIDQASSLSDVVDPFNFNSHARPFGLESDPQLCGNL